MNTVLKMGQAIVWQSSDQLLKQKIDSLDKQTLDLHAAKYFPIIHRYLKKFCSQTDVDSSVKYPYVSRSIDRLLRVSGKESTYLPVMKEFEGMLKEVLPKYRDHFIHSFNVFLLGYYILNRLKSIKTDFDFRSNFPNLCWMLAATHHDSAYVIEKMEFWLNKLLEKFLGVNPGLSSNIAQILPMTYFDFMRAISCWHKQPMGNLAGYNLDAVDLALLNEMNISITQRRDHGVLGSLMLVHSLAIKQGFLAREGVYGNFLYTHIPACHAISIHHLSSIRIVFSKHPLAFLLVLCDELQDWGRPTKSGLSKQSIELRDIQVTNDIIPTIAVTISAPKRKEQMLIKALGRLHTGDSIRLSISNEKGKTILSK